MPVALAVLLLSLLSGSGVGEPRFEPALEPATGALGPGASALDAWAALADADERAYSLPGTGLRSFAARVRSPELSRLAAERSDVDPAELQFVLWWESPDRRRVTLSGARGEMEAGLVDALSGLVQPLHELLLPVPPSQRLRGHAFLFVEGPEPTGRAVIEARARNPDDPRRLARFTIGESGLVVREWSATAEGEESDYHYAYRRVQGHEVLVGVTGLHRGHRVDLTIDWGSEVDGLLVPTRVTMRQLDGLGELEGPLAEIEYRISGHRLDERLPDWVWLTGASPRGRR